MFLLAVVVPSLCCHAQVAFVEMPSFNFDLTLYGGDIGFLPGLEAWITAVIKDSVLRYGTHANHSQIKLGWIRQGKARLTQVRSRSCHATLGWAGSGQGKRIPLTVFRGNTTPILSATTLSSPVVLPEQLNIQPLHLLSISCTHHLHCQLCRH